MYYSYWLAQNALQVWMWNVYSCSCVLWSDEFVTRKNEHLQLLHLHVKREVRCGDRNRVITSTNERKLSGCLSKSKALQLQQHLVWIPLFYGLNAKKIHCLMIFYHVSLAKAESLLVCVKRGFGSKGDNAAQPLHLSSSGFQHPGAEFWIVAVPAVLHVCSAVWGEALVLPLPERGMIMCFYEAGVSSCCVVCQRGREVSLWRLPICLEDIWNKMTD